MPAIAPTPITALGTSPTTADPASFDTRADALLGALPTLVTQTNATSDNVFDNAVFAQGQANASEASAVAGALSASASDASALAAAASTGATLWTSGTYTIGQTRFSPVNQRIYRCIANHTGSTDPSAAPANWALVENAMPVLVVSTTTATALGGTHHVLTNVAATTLTLPLSPASGATVWATFTNALATNVIARNGQTIMGFAEDLDINNTRGVTVRLRFVNSSWRLV